MKKKYTKIILGILACLIVLLVFLAIIIARYNKDKVKEIFINGINKYMSTDVSFTDFDLSLLEKFPNASFQFKNVIIKDATLLKKDTLLKAGTVYLQFNIFDLIDKKYIIKDIEVKNGFSRVVIYKDGSDNYHCLKKSTDSTDKAFEINLKKIVLKNMHITFRSISNDQYYSFLVNNGSLKGKFTDKQSTIHSDVSSFIYCLRSNGINYIKDKQSEIEFSMNTDNAKGNYKITDGNMQVGNLHFTTGGYVIYHDKTRYLDFRFIGKKIQLQTFVEEFPEYYKHSLKDYNCNGELAFNMRVKGHFEKENLPEMSVAFNLKDADIKYLPTAVVLKNIDLKGFYTTGASSKLESNKLILENFSANLESGNIKGKYSMKNFVHPQIDLKASADLDLHELKEFIPMDTIQSVNGKLTIDVAFKSTLDNLKNFTSSDFINSQTDGKLKFSNVHFTIKKNLLKFTDFNSDLSFNNNDIFINSFSGNISKTNLTIQGDLKNILSFVFLPNQKLTVDGQLNSKMIDLNELLSDKKTDDAGTYKLIFSPNLELNLTSKIDKIIFRKFTGEHLTGELQYKDKKLFLNSLKGNAMGGEVAVSGIIDATDLKEITLKCGVAVNRANITKLFYQMENFGQKNLTDKNIRGLASADITFSATCTPELKIKPASIIATSDVTIEQGELINYESLKALSRFIKLDDLMNVKFSTLKNQIEIKDQTIHIPSMEINSTALNITLTGKHTFNNEINYNIRLLLSEILSKKAKKAKKENEIFGEEMDDGLGRTTLYLLVTGTMSDPVFKYDRKGVKEKLKKDIKKEKQNLRQILKDEWGLFKKDSTLKKDPNNNKSSIQVIWDEKDD